MTIRSHALRLRGTTNQHSRTRKTVRPLLRNSPGTKAAPSRAVVDTVRVLVTAVVPVTWSAAGERARPGRSVGFVSFVFTTQVRFTIPAKPFVDATDLHENTSRVLIS